MSQNPVSYKETIEGNGSNFLDKLKVLTGGLVCVEKQLQMVNVLFGCRL